MSKQRRKPPGFCEKDTEILLRAKRENKMVSFDSRGFPVIKEPPQEYHPRHMTKPDTPQVGGETVSVQPGSLLSPIEDVLMMAETLELFASHCSERLSDIERRREDCTHQLEPQRDEDGIIVDFIPDDMILAIGKKLQRIGKERRNIKNRFEIIKTVKRGFASRPGQESLAFLRTLLAEVAGLVAEQRQRMYTPRTDELDDLFDEPRAKYIDLKSMMPDGDYDDPAGHDDPMSVMSEEMLNKLLREYEESAALESAKEAVPV